MDKEIYSILGSIQKEMEYVRKNTDAIDNKVDAATRNIIIIEQSTKSAHKRIDEMKDEVKDVKKGVKDYRDNKNKVVGAIAILSLFFSTIGIVISKYFTKIL